ncbi:hypothetical protein TCT1_16860 [Xenorhabdus sp. TCT-1]|uniref:Uncharacterized protein n=1 Tax=Xenorhabdus taiwanensis TaxID=3085177 RepID=A0ABM8JWI2_9GAMM|nr:hypothetical protein TCT1_16860 [Xenorhabdus sp. TCT-1]
MYDYTQWSIVADLTNLKYDIKIYTDSVLRCISFNDFDLDASVDVSHPMVSSKVPDLIPE